MSEDFSIRQIEMELSRLREKVQSHKPEVTGKDGASFGQVLKDAISEVNQLSLDADEAVQTQMVSGENTDLHSTILAVEKAEISFQAMMQIRNKILKAYEEIMRMPV